MGKSVKEGKELGIGISQRKDGLYQGRFVNRFGVRKTVYAKTYSEIRKKLREAQYEDEKGITAVDKKMTLDEFYNVWISTCKKHCRNTTKHTYEIQYNRLKPYIGHYKLSALNLVILQEAFNELKSDASRRACKALLVDILNRAMETDLIIKNVAIGVNTSIDHTEKTEKRVLTDAEEQLLYNASKDSQLYPIFILALNTGMRIGEILGLTWDCIDFEKGIIQVEKTLCYLPNKGKAIYEFHRPKTTAGKRSIPMSLQVKKVMLSHKQWNHRVQEKYEAQEGFEDLVFISKTNHPLHESNIRTAIRYLIAKIQKENTEFKEFTPHCLRHTFASKCIAKGMKPKTLQKILGHNSLQMTMDLYCHVFSETMKEEMALVTEMV